MVKHKFNLVGNTFNYSDAPRCSVWGKKSKFTEWVDEGGDGTFYVDSAIGLGSLMMRGLDLSMPGFLSPVPLFFSDH